MNRVSFSDILAVLREEAKLKIGNLDTLKSAEVSHLLIGLLC